MGVGYSIPEDSKLTVSEIKRLHKRFCKIDVDNSKTLSAEEIQAIPGLEANPLVRRVIDIFDTDNNKEIDFKEFLEGISMFIAREGTESRLRFIFKMYDIDDDGFISNAELFMVLKETVVRFIELSMVLKTVIVMSITSHGAENMVLV